MNKVSPILSLCVPTNGMAQLIIPLLESIYNQKCNESDFEVIVMDNGVSSELESLISKYIGIHNNLVYKKTNSILFQNQIECFKLAKGNFVKFVNHRSILKNNSINFYIEYAKKYYYQKPIIYFLNGNIQNVVSNTLIDFDTFMNNLSYFSSWSGGLSCWRSDYEKIFKKNKYNYYFPHLDILLKFKNSRKYVINNDSLSYDQSFDVSKKGKYDLFDAFLVSFMNIIYSLYENKFISIKTYKKIKYENLFFCIRLHFNYVIKKQKCSYILQNFWESFTKYYTPFDFILGYSKIIMLLPISVMKKLSRTIFRDEK